FSSNNHLTVQQLTSSDFSLGDLVHATLNLSSHVHLHLQVSFNGSQSLPSLGTDFHLDWKFLNADTEGSQLDFGGVPFIGFDYVTLALGSFVTKLIQPIMDTVNMILDPIRPIVNTLNTALPGFSNLPSSIISALSLDAYDHDGDVSLLDFTQKYLDGSGWG